MNKATLIIKVQEASNISCTFCGGQLNKGDEVIIKQDFQTLQTEIIHKECEEGDIDE